jgi:glycosyltransferase involved in cell wall biosynthesis
VVSGETGYVFKKGDCDHAAEMLSKLYNDPELLQRLGRNANRKVSDEFSVKQFARRFKMLIAP